MLWIFQYPWATLFDSELRLLEFTASFQGIATPTAYLASRTFRNYLPNYHSENGNRCLIRVTQLGEYGIQNMGSNVISSKSTMRGPFYRSICYIGQLDSRLVTIDLNVSYVLNAHCRRVTYDLNLQSW